MPDVLGFRGTAEASPGRPGAVERMPTRSYVRLSADQRDALVATFSALARLVP